MRLEHKISEIQALNGNKENTVIKQYRRFILAKQKVLNRLDNNYDQELTPMGTPNSTM